MANQRISYLDMVKGIGMLWVVMGHITTISFLSSYIYSFHMMLFFFISGVFMNIDKYESFKSFFKSRFKSLYVPFFLMYIVLFMYWFLAERHMRTTEIPPLHAVLGLFWGSDTNYWMYCSGPLWFVVCLFSLELFSYPLLKIHKTKRLLALSIYSALFVLGVVLAIIGKKGLIPLYCLPFSLNNALIVIPFFVIGYLMREFLLSGISNKSNKLIVLSTITLFVLSIISSQFLKVDISYLKVSNWVLYCIIPFFGIFSWFGVSKLIDNSKTLEWIGRNTLPILAFHGPVIRIAVFVIGGVIGTSKFELKEDIMLNILIFIVAVIICIPIVYLWNCGYGKFVKPQLQKL